MSISASIPVALMQAANDELEALGHGPGNFSIAMKASGETATHAGLHCWDEPSFKAALIAMRDSGNYPGLNLSETCFDNHATDQALQWSDPTNWTQNPVMKGAKRTFNGKTWESLLDYNVWTPPVGWREVVADGYPAWIQPTGAHDAYALGAKVKHKNQNWVSGYAANVWEPGVFGWTVVP